MLLSVALLSRWCQAYSLWKPSQDQLLHYESLLPWRITCPGLSIRHPAATRRGVTPDTAHTFMLDCPLFFYYTKGQERNVPWFHYF